MLYKLVFYAVCFPAILYVCAILFAGYIAPKMVFPVVSSSYEALPESHMLETSDGDTIVMLHLASKANAPLILYSHGNGEDLGHIFPHLKELQKRGVGILAYDYPGYGRSSGQPTEKGVFAAADAVYTYATKVLGIPPSQIVLYGRSLGSGPSTWLASKYPVAGVILDGAFTSTFRVLTRIKILPFDIFDNLPRLRASTCPYLLIHGKQDWTVPFRHAEINLRVLGSRARHFWVADAGHNNLVELAGENYWESVLHFTHEVTNLKPQ